MDPQIWIPQKWPGVKVFGSPGDPLHLLRSPTMAGALGFLSCKALSLTLDSAQVQDETPDVAAIEMSLA